MFARTERLLLRPAWREDAPALAAAIGDEAIVRNLATAPWPYALEHAESFIAREPDLRHPSLLIFARTGRAPRLVGGIGIGLDPEGRTELGYWIARAHWGRGYATEAGRAVLGMAKALGHGPLLAGHFLDNPASGAVLRKLGFRPTGKVIRRHSLARGGEAQCATFVQEAEACEEGVAAMRCLEAA